MSAQLERSRLLKSESRSAFPQFRTAVDGPDSEYGELKEVLLACPQHLRIVPCNRVSEDALQHGRCADPARARAQHRRLRETLTEAGAKVRNVASVAGLPDLVFTRDTSLMTPWGLIGLRPGAQHRRGEVDVVLRAAEDAGFPVLGRVTEGSVEGGDVCLLRPGHLVVGVSEDRTTETGAIALGSFFEARGWTVTRTLVDPDLLHLDTHFCMVDRNLALGCVEKLNGAFVRLVEELGIELVPVTPDEVASLACNILSLGRGQVVSTGSAPRVDQLLRGRGYRVFPVALDEFTQCGGGVHCLTMPLRRSAAS